VQKRHDGRRRLVPQRERDTLTLHQLRMNVVARRDAIEHGLRQVLLTRYVSRDSNGWEWRRDGNMGGFGIDKEMNV
ncbi:MAG: hypothetical protein Q9161_008536, partial [Pseudevernia consocians]